MQKNILQALIQKKEKQICLLSLVFRAVRKFQETKNMKYEKKYLQDLEAEIFEI